MSKQTVYDSRTRWIWCKFVAEGLAEECSSSTLRRFRILVVVSNCIVTCGKIVEVEGQGREIRTELANLGYAVGIYDLFMREVTGELMSNS